MRSKWRRRGDGGGDGGFGLDFRGAQCHRRGGSFSPYTKAGSAEKEKVPSAVVLEVVGI